jgi:hypothetical protein
MINWPTKLAPRDLSANINPRNTKGTTNSEGVTQSISGRSAIWMVKYKGVAVPPSKVKLWRAIQIQAEGTVNPLVIPLYEPNRAPVASGAPAFGIWGDQRRSTGKGIPHSDGTFFSDGTGYAPGGAGGTLNAPIPRGGVTATIAMGKKKLEAGTIFSIGVRAYMVKEVLTVSYDGIHYIKFGPNAREAVASGSHVEFDEPRLKVRLASDTEMDIELMLGRWGFPDVSFIEDLS